MRIREILGMDDPQDSWGSLMPGIKELDALYDKTVKLTDNFRLTLDELNKPAAKDLIIGLDEVNELLRDRHNILPKFKKKLETLNWFLSS